MLNTKPDFRCFSEVMTPSLFPVGRDAKDMVDPSSMGVFIVIVTKGRSCLKLVSVENLPLLLKASRCCGNFALEVPLEFCMPFVSSVTRRSRMVVTFSR